jgi:predicted dehydrogenase
MKRRQFLQQAVVLGATVSLPTILTMPLRGQAAPSNRIRIACIGLGGMGMYHLKGLVAMPQCEVVALCDVDRRKMAAARSIAGVSEEACTQDFRELLARSDVDAVNIATPDHWHVPMAMAASKAGKSVYVQKPISMNVREGRALVELAKDLGTVMQVGSQQRSSRNFRHAAELVRNGYLGTITSIVVGLEKPYNPDPGMAPPEPVPAELGYEMWLGPAPFKPYSSERVAHFRSSFDYSGGYFSDWAAHHLDIVQWALGKDDSGPVAVEGTGVFHDRGTFNVPMSYEVKYRYAEGVPVVASEKFENGIRFEGTEGWVFVNRDKYTASRKSLLSLRMAPTDVRLLESEDHTVNFFDAVASGRPVVAPAEAGHRSASMCHIGNIAMRLGRALDWDPAKEEFVSDDQANRLLGGVQRQDWKLT